MNKMVILFGVLLCVATGIWIFQRLPANIHVQGYLDQEQRIAYVGGLDSDSNNVFYVQPLWRHNSVTREEIEHYVQTSHEVGQKLLRDGVKDFYLGVTFHQYMSVADFETFTSRMGTQVTHFRLRCTYPHLDPNDRVTIDGVPSGDKLVDPTQLKRAMDELYVQAKKKKQAQEKQAERIAAQQTGKPVASADGSQATLPNAIWLADGDAVLNGVYAFETVTDAEGYQRLLHDPHVYHIDVTATLVYQQIKDKGVRWQDFVSIPNLGDYDPFWNMESIGLDTFK